MPCHPILGTMYYEVLLAIIPGFKLHWLPRHLVHIVDKLGAQTVADFLEGEIRLADMSDMTGQG